MKILLLVQRAQMRGAEVFAAHLASHLKENNHEPILVYLFEGKAELPFHGKCYHLNGNPRKRFYDYPAWKRLAMIIQQESPDIIQANAGDTLKYAVFSKILFGWSEQIVFRNASTISLYIKNWMAKWWNRFQFAYVSKVISVSESSATDFSRIFPSCKHKLTVIPGGIETSGSGHCGNIRIKKTPIVSLLHVGGFTYEKNHEGLIRIFELILAKNPDVRLHLVGGGPLKNTVAQLVHDKSLDRHIRFHPTRKTAQRFIKNATALLLPSVIEGLPAVILESFYHRTPVIAYDVGGIAEVLKNGSTGYLVPAGNETEFAQAVMRCIDNRPETLLDNAYQLVCTVYNNKKIAKEFISVYQALLFKNDLPAELPVIESR